MLNEYAEYLMMKLRQEETNRNAKSAWKSYVEMSDNKNLPGLSFQPNPATVQCCPCACN